MRQANRDRLFTLTKDDLITVAKLYFNQEKAMMGVFGTSANKELIDQNNQWVYQE